MTSQYGLVFCPKLLTYRPENTDDFIKYLQEEGVIGPFFEVNDHKGYLIGENFLKLITFLGCSPHIEVTLPEPLSSWVNFCHIQIQTVDVPKFFKGLNAPKCSCPHCKSRVSKALPEMKQWSPEVQILNCPKCHQKTLIEQLNWRHGAGFGQIFMIVNSVYPNEAVPADKLMNLLVSATGIDWDYFYFERD